MITLKVARRLPPSSRLALSGPSTWILRCFADQTLSPSARPTSSSPPIPTSLQDNGAPKAEERPPGRSELRQKATAELSGLMNQMMTQQNKSRGPPRRPRRPRTSSADEVAAELDRLSINPAARRQGQILEGMNQNRDINFDVLNIGQRATKLPPLNPPVRCDAYIGRAEPVGRGVTLARAIEKLNMKLAYNRVRSDIRRQKFHERGGLRRKRLRRERWRFRFKAGFKAAITKIQKMASQGW